MSTDPRFKCSQYKKCKLSDEFGTRQRAGSHGERGDLNICLSCATLNSANRKRKRLVSEPEPPVKRFAMPPAFSPGHPLRIGPDTNGGTGYQL